MAEEIVPSAAPVAQVSTPAAEVPASVPVSTPEPIATVLGAEPLVAPVEAPKTEVIEPPKEIEKPVEVKAEEKVAEPKVEEKKTEEVKTEVKSEDKTSEVKTEEAALPVYEALVLPEGTTLPPEQVKQIDSMFGNFEKIAKIDHVEASRFRQAMVDYGVGVIKDAQNALHEAYINSWKEKRDTWRKEFEADSEYGGNRKDTTVSAANQFIRTHGGTVEQQKELRSLLEETGLGNHKAIIRSFANANLARAEGQPLPAVAPPAAKMSRFQKMYGQGKKK